MLIKSRENEMFPVYEVEETAEPNGNQTNSLGRRNLQISPLCLRACKPDE